MKIFASALLFLAGASILPGTGAAKGCFELSEHFHPEDWAYCQPLTEDIFMYYTPFEEEGNVMLGLHVAKEATGWTALAFGGNGGMKGASQIVVRLNETNDWIAEDRFSNDYVTPSLDDHQDVKLLFADQTDDGETSWGVLVPMNGCDENDYPIEDKSIFMHWAMGSDHSFGFHGTRRAQFKANLFQAPLEEPSTEGLTYVDLLMPNVPVVLGEGGQDPTNPYICSFFDMEQVAEDRQGGKVHAIRFSPVLAEESKQYVHHMLLYACGGEEDSDDDDGEWEGGEVEHSHLAIIPECESMPPGCSELKWLWAVGSTDVIFPPDVGMPIDENQRFLVLQMHYYNKNLDEGITDNSGVRAYLTTDLREQEAGVLAFNGGTSEWQRPALPSGVSNFHLPTFTVPSACTQHEWNEPLSILGVFHHMHLYGTKMEISVEREGVNMGPMRVEHHYDFNHQSLEDPRPELRSLLPGDQIRMDCWYDTTSAPEEVSFGDLTQQEMCYGGVIYWPKQEEDSFGFMETVDSEQCLTPATDELLAAHNVSMCAQNLVENVPKFFDFEDWVPAPFGLQTVCNGGDAFSDLQGWIPNLCPSCGDNNNCTAEEVGLHAQGFCVGYCSDMVNVTTWPDMSDTEPHDAGAWGCPEHVEFFKSPPMKEPPVCEKAGNLDQVVVLQKATLSSGSSSVWSGRVAVLLGLVIAAWGF